MGHRSLEGLCVGLALLVSATARGDDAPGYQASVEVADTKGANHAIVTAKLACGQPAKCPAWTLDLGPAEAASVLALVDLAGAPTHVRGDGSADHTQGLSGSAKLPAAVVRTIATDAVGSRWERWAIVSLDGGRAKLMWRGELAMRSKDGGGFATNDGIELAATEPGKPLALVFAQTAIPKPSDKPRPPAKPVARRFVLEDGSYQRK